MESPDALPALHEGYVGRVGAGGWSPAGTELPTARSGGPPVTPAPHITPNELRTVRRLRGWTQQEMADELGLTSKMAVWRAEAGRGALNATARVVVAGWMDELKAAGKWPNEE